MSVPQEAKSNLQQLPSAKCLAPADKESARQIALQSSSHLSPHFSYCSYILDATFYTCKVDNTTRVAHYQFFTFALISFGKMSFQIEAHKPFGQFLMRG